MECECVGDLCCYRKQLWNVAVWMTCVVHEAAVECGCVGDLHCYRKQLWNVAVWVTCTAT